jgi:hypothetical protein
MLTRGFTVSFALPEEYREWVQSDGFEYGAPFSFISHKFEI